MDLDMRDFLRIEEEYDLSHVSVNGINCWQFVRHPLWSFYICTEKLGTSTPQPEPKRTAAQKAKYYGKSAAELLFEPIKVPHRVDVLFLNHERRAKNGDYYDCLYTEELNTRFRYTATIETVFKRGHFTPVRTPNLIYTDQILFKTSVATKLHALLFPKDRERIRKEVSDRYQPALTAIREAYQCSFDVETIIDRLTSVAERFPTERKAYQKLLKKLNPKVIVEVVHYAYHKMLINELAREMGIPVIELQHGIISDHLAYRYAGDTAVPQLPDYFFLFSSFWKPFPEHFVPGEALIPVGYPYFEGKLKEYARMPRPDKRRTLIFLSQGAIGKSLCELAVRLSPLLDPKTVRVIYKLHPEEYSVWESEYPELKSTGFEIISDNKVSLYQLFAESDVQIGVYSTALYEGLGFGLQTMIFKTGLYQTMLPLVEAGYARLVEDESDVMRVLQQGEGEAESRQAASFWESDSMDKMLREISRICPEAERKDVSA